MGQSCSVGQNLENGLCYKQCRTGYYGVADYCWQSCPSNFPDSGLTFCEKPDGYGRGIGYSSKEACESSSTHGAQENGCEINGVRWYPICDKNFHNYDCCWCSATCPAGMSDAGLTCEKDRYNRGVGVIPTLGMSWTTILIIILALLIVLMISIKI